MIAGTADKRFGALGRMGVVAAIHVAALFVIARSLGIIPQIDVEPKRVVMEILDRPQPPDDPPPTTDFKPDQNVNVYVPEPDVAPVERDDPLPRDTIEGTTNKPPQTERGSNEVQPAMVPVSLDARHPLTQPPYPGARIRNGDEGAVDLQLYVLPNGRVGDARVLKSSGFEDFDQSALQEARRAWRLVPATRDGVPYAQWYSLRVVFKLKNAR